MTEVELGGRAQYRRVSGEILYGLVIEVSPTTATIQLDETRRRIKIERRRIKMVSRRRG